MDKPVTLPARIAFSYGEIVRENGNENQIGTKNVRTPRKQYIFGGPKHQSWIKDTSLMMTLSSVPWVP